MGVELLAAISVDYDLRLLARCHASEVLFLEVRLDPRVGAVDEADHADALHGHLTDLQFVRILDYAVHRRAHVGAL